MSNSRNYAAPFDENMRRCLTGHLPLHDAIPRVVPDEWRVTGPFGDGNKYEHRNGLRVIVSTAGYPDGRDWMHIALSRKDRMPSWDDLKLVKSVFAGNDRYAYQVFPPADRHINLHDFCLHLWVPLTGDPPLVDFTMGGSTI